MLYRLNVDSKLDYVEGIYFEYECMSKNSIFYYKPGVKETKNGYCRVETKSSLRHELYFPHAVNLKFPSPWKVVVLQYSFPGLKEIIRIISRSFTSSQNIVHFFMDDETF